jgi:hypothetical protein
MGSGACAGWFEESMVELECLGFRGLDLDFEGSGGGMMVYFVLMRVCELLDTGMWGGAKGAAYGRGAGLQEKGGLGEPLLGRL